MEKVGATYKLLICSLFIALVWLPCQVTPQEVEDESEFNYVEGGPKGPSRWGLIKKEWRKCKTGRMQSPIDLMNKRVHINHHLGPLHFHYHPANATLKNRGHDIQLGWATGAGYLQINNNGIKYVLKQYHWHSPSEHAIDSKRFALELHMVHESKAGEIAVIGILYKLGKPDPFLSSLRDPLEEISDTTDKDVAVGIVDPYSIQLNGNEPYYRYMGSLTTPPCTENVTWTVLKQVRTVSKDQVNLLRVAVHDESNTNARPLQPINNRLVELYQPKHHYND